MTSGGDESIIDFDAAARLRLEGKLRRLVMERDALAQTMRDNHAVMTQVHSAVLALVDARDLAMLDQRLGGHVRHALGADVLKVIIEGLQSPPEAHAITGAPAGFVVRIMQGHAERLGPCQPLSAQIFDAPGLSSEALIRLNVRGRDGMLALGSRDRLGFKADQGTDMAAFLARVIERLVAAWAPV